MTTRSIISRYFDQFCAEVFDLCPLSTCIISTRNHVVYIIFRGVGVLSRVPTGSETLTLYNVIHNVKMYLVRSIGIGFRVLRIFSDLVFFLIFEVSKVLVGRFR